MREVIRLSKVIGVNVKDYGAYGDNVHDDTIAIQSAIDASTGGVIFFPAGTYVISNTIKVHSNQTLCGEGKNISILRMSAVGKDGIQVNNAEHVTIRELQVRDIINPGSAESRAIRIRASKHCKVEHCRVYNTDDSGIRVGYDDATGWSMHCQVLHCEVENTTGGSGIEVIKAYDTLVDGCTVINSLEHGIRICGAIRTTVVNNTIEGSGNADITAQGFGSSTGVSQPLENFIIKGNTCKGSGLGYGITMYFQASKGIVSSNKIMNSLIGIRLYDPEGNGTQNIHCVDNMIADCGTGILVYGEHKSLTFSQNHVMNWTNPSVAYEYAAAVVIDAHNNDLDFVFFEDNMIVQANPVSNKKQVSFYIANLTNNSNIYVRYNNISLLNSFSLFNSIYRRGSRGKVTTTFALMNTNTEVLSS